MQERHQNIQKVRYSSRIDNQKPRISAALWPDMWQACWDTQWHTLQSNLTRKEQEGVRELCAVHPSLGPAIVFLQECNACHNDFKAPWSKKKNVQSGTKPACLRITSPGCGVQFFQYACPISSAESPALACEKYLTMKKEAGHGVLRHIDVAVRIHEVPLGQTCPLPPQGQLPHRSRA